MLESGTELITLTSELDYSPTFVSTDKRQPTGAKTSLGYWQIGETEQYGFARGPVFKIEFAYLNITSTHIKIWGIDNIDDDGVIYPKTFFTNNPTMHVYLKKFAYSIQKFRNLNIFSKKRIFYFLVLKLEIFFRSIPRKKIRKIEFRNFFSIFKKNFQNIGN